MKLILKKYIPTSLIKNVKSVYRKYQCLKYKGEGVICNICHSEFKSFVKFYGRENALCPNCGSLERHRLIKFYFEEKTPIFNDNVNLFQVAPSKVLYHLFNTYKNINYYPCDLFPQNYPSQKLHKQDLTKLNIDDNSFDFAIASHVLEHIDNDFDAMSELYRILKNGGVAYILVPIKSGTTYEDNSITSSKDRMKHFGQEDHVRFYGLDIVDRLNSVGFQTETIDYVQQKANTDKKQFGLRSEIIFKCVKP